MVRLPPRLPLEGRPGSLFRPAALRARSVPAYGDVVLVRPPSLRSASVAAAVVAILLVCFLVRGTYTEHTSLSGRLVPDLGVIGVYAPQPGTIVERQVREGDVVGIDDVLYVVSSERISSALGATRASVGRTLNERAAAIAEQIRSTRRLAEGHRTSVERTRDALAAEAANLTAMIARQRRRTDLAGEMFARYRDIEPEGFVSREQLAAREQDWMEQQSRLDNLERERNHLERQRMELGRELESVPLEYGNRVAELERALARNRQELMESEAMRRISVTAPAAGTVTAVIGRVGEAVDGSRALASIVPRAATLEAHLYAPSGAVGFIDVGDPVLLRYEAYPYQSFGHQPGTVTSISRTALSGAELDAGAGWSPAVGPMYRVTVKLSAQSLEARGRSHRLQPGMALEADVLGETRRLYQWMLDPLRTLLGRVH